MKPLRVWLVGFGTVGRWVMRALDSERERLAGNYGVELTVVGLANARDGFIYAGNGLDLPFALFAATPKLQAAQLENLQFERFDLDCIRKNLLVFGGE